MNLSILSGPIIGAMIGYGTNWIAIKMLFRPRNPIKVGKFTFPFTPGIIPRRKQKLAHAIGQMVGNHLLTKKDFQQMLLAEEVENSIITKIFSSFESESAIKTALIEIVDEKKYQNGRELLKLCISEKIKGGLISANIGEMIANEGGQVIRKKVSGSMLKMFVTDNLIDSIVNPMGNEIETYMKEHAQEKIMPIVENELVSFESCSIKDLMKKLKFEEEELRKVIQNVYQNLICNDIGNLLEKMDIVKMVEGKINQMEVVELEKLLLSIMKKELRAIVNLGALIGFILGSLNLFL